MATYEFQLVDPPVEPRSRELWLQHAAGFIIFEDVRRYAIERIDPALTDEAKAAAMKGIDDAVYGLMMVIDGVTGCIANASHNVSIDFLVRVTARDKGGDCEAVSEYNLRDGDGMCMGYHGWCEGDFGEDPITVPRSSKE